MNTSSINFYWISISLFRAKNKDASQFRFFFKSGSPTETGKAQVKFIYSEISVWCPGKISRRIICPIGRESVSIMVGVGIFSSCSMKLQEWALSTSCETGPDCRPNLLQSDNDVQGLGSTSHPSFGIQDSNFDCNTPPRRLRRIQASESKIRILIAGDLHAGFVASTSHPSFGIQSI